MTTLDLAIIGNARTAALVDACGRIVWWCLPRYDGDPVFYALLDHGDASAGVFAVDVVGQVSATQAYRRNTAILETMLADLDGNLLRITDFAPRFQQFDRAYRPMSLIRRLEPVSGTPRIRLRLRPRFGYGAQRPMCTYGSNHVRYTSADLALRLTTDVPVSYVVEESSFLLDGPAHMILGADESLTAPVEETTRQFLERTEAYWQDWVRYLSVPFDWQDAVIRAAITLKLCSFEETGAIVAALTTSIPEAPDTPRTWDYRFCWPRDAYFTVHALNRLGATKTMEHYIRYITNVAALAIDGDLKPVHNVLPEAGLPERIVDSLPGYRGMGPVRVGNAARDQVQNDGYGSVVLAAAQMFFDRRLPKVGDQGLYTRLATLGRQAVRKAFEPDAGPWEYRGRQQVHTFSSMMCWAACDRLARIAQALGLATDAADWHAAAERIRPVILDRAFNRKRNSFVSAFDGEDVDASLLLLFEMGLVSATDPRFLGTIRAIETDLRHGNLLFRYAAPDDFGRPSTAFTTCTFWYVDALAVTGRQDEARTVFEQLMSRRNHVGLLSEDLSIKSGEQWGNFPQTYSMVGLIVSAMRLSRSWEEGFWRGS